MDSYLDLGMSLQILALFFMMMKSFSKHLWVSRLLGKSRNGKEWRVYLSGYLNLPRVLFP
jgi:hypothetical protein